MQPPFRWRRSRPRRAGSGSRATPPDSRTPLRDPRRGTGERDLRPRSSGPQATAQSTASAIPARSWARLDLPIPASPGQSTTRPAPARAASTAAARRAHVAARRSRRAPPWQASQPRPDHGRHPPGASGARPCPVDQRPRSPRPDGPRLRCRATRVRPVREPPSALPRAIWITKPIARDPRDTA